jgi:GNAT superfamily N-acetyltransferase
MKSELELVAAAHENFIASFRKLVEHSPEGAIRESGGIFAFVTRLPISLFNGVVVTEPTTAAELEAALEWVSGRSVPYRAFVADKLVAELGEIPTVRGLEREAAPYPGMVLQPAPEAPAPPAGVTVAASGLGEFLGVLVEGGMAPDVARRLVSPSFAADPEVRLFVGQLDVRPVGTSIAIRSRSVSGVYNVGTHPDARRRGVGTALTWAAIAAGRAWGCDVIVLQSSAMGISMYSEMGFRTVAPYTIFTKHAPAKDEE